MLALLFAVYMLPAGVFHCLQENGGRSLGSACQCSDCHDLVSTVAEESQGQLDCCAVARQYRQTHLDLAGTGLVSSPEHDCCAHFKIITGITQSHVEAKAVRLGELFALESNEPTIGLSSFEARNFALIRGSPPTSLADSAKASTASRLLL
jgi:hypothetical protein